MRIRTGKNRQIWRIREYLQGEGLSMTDVARTLGVSLSVVSDTVRGIRNSRKVLAHLRDMGCPERYLDLPEDLKTQDAA